jgi:hypothetical protein
MINTNLVVGTRLPRAGLGNRLIPWARAFAYSRKHGIRFTEPFWPQFSLGPMLRRERDKRIYSSEFRSLYRMSDIIRQRVYSWIGRISIDPPLDYPPNKNSQVYLFESYNRYFEGLAPFKSEIHERLLEVTLARWKNIVEQFGSIDIALHVRRGDFPANWKSSSKWFSETLSSVQAVLDTTPRCVVFSDAAPDALTDLLSLPNTEYAFTGSAISDLLLMSRAKVLIGSCHSSFSAWACFLGGMPTLIDSAQPFEFFHLEPPEFPIYEFIPGQTTAYKLSQWLRAPY